MSLQLAERDADRARLDAVLKSMGLSLIVKKGSPTRVIRSIDQAALANREFLIDGGLTLEGVEERLNSGQSVNLTLPTFNVPLPMPPQSWAAGSFGPATPVGSLLRMLLRDQRLASVYNGLLSLDPYTRAYFSASPKLTARIYSNYAALFGAYGQSLHVRDEHVEVPGGTDAIAFWESLAGEKVNRPDRFLEALLSVNEGRLAYFYDLIAHLDPARARFALGLNEIAGTRSIRQRADDIYGWFNLADSRWTPGLSRPLADPSLLLVLAEVDRSGRPAGPAWRYLWTAVFGGEDLPDRPERELRPAAEVASAAFWIELVQGKRDESRDRLHAILFAQRVFASAPETSAKDMLVALRGFLRFPILHLTLERMGIRTPAIHAAAARRAAALSAIQNADVAVASISQFQGALALLECARFTGRLPVNDLPGLLESLIAIDVDRDGSYGAQLALWLDKRLLPAIAPTGSSDESAPTERAILGGAAGLRAFRDPDADDAPGPVVEWEGFRYRIDPSQALFDRARKVRARQAGHTLDAVLKLARTSADLSLDLTMDGLAKQLAAVKQLQTELRQPHMPTTLTDAKALVVSETLSEARRELERIKDSKQIKNAARAGRLLDQLSAELTADVLRAIVYAMHLADPDSPLLAAGDVSFRHDLGLSQQSRSARERTAWGIPSAQGAQGAKWRVKGSLLGLDLALASVASRRVLAGKPPEVPVWNRFDSDWYVPVLALFNPSEATPESMQVVADAIKKGRDRVNHLVTDRGDLSAVFDAVRISPMRRAMVEWMLDRQPESVVTVFSLSDLLRIGGGDEASRAGDYWGAPAQGLTGCLCLGLGSPIDWDAFDGRRGEGALAAKLPDLLLRIAELFVELKMPPHVAADILPAAVQDLIDRSRPSHADDWLAIVRRAAALDHRTVEDYVSGVTAGRSMVPLSAVVR